MPLPISIREKDEAEAAAANGEVLKAGMKRKRPPLENPGLAKKLVFD